MSPVHVRIDDARVRSERKLVNIVLLLALKDRATEVEFTRTADPTGELRQELTDGDEADEAACAWTEMTHVWTIRYCVDGTFYDMVPAPDVPIGQAAWKMVPPWRRFGMTWRVCIDKLRRRPVTLEKPLRLVVFGHSVPATLVIALDDPAGSPRVTFRLPADHGCAELAAAALNGYQRQFASAPPGGRG